MGKIQSKQPLIEFDQIITADGITFDLNDAWDRWLFSISGEGMPPIRWITDSGPFQDGDTVRDYRLRPRVLQYQMRWGPSCSRQEYWENRRLMLEMVRPNRSTTGERFGQVRLVKTLPIGTDGPQKLYLNAVVESGPAFKPRDVARWDEWALNETIRFIANDPIWTADEGKSESAIFEQAYELVFPITFDADNIIFSGDNLEEDLNCITLGTYTVYPTIILTGPMTNPTIENLTTGESISLAYVLPAGRVITIDLAYGQKTVIDDLGTNLIGTVTPDSELADFHLAPNPEATGGLNIVKVSANGLETDSEFEITWHDKFIGI